MFVRSGRESNFLSYVGIIRTMMPWFFALGHINYSRWMTVICKEFLRGKFTVSKTGRKFSAMGDDQAHEQHNKVIKEDGGGVGLFDKSNAILEWTLTAPYIAQLLDDAVVNDDQNHHEDNDRFERTFLSNCEALHAAWQKYGNPFEEDIPGLVHLTSKRILPDNAEKSVRNAHIVGIEQYNKFSTSRKGLYDPIKKNSLDLFWQKNVVASSKAKQKFVTLKERCNLFKDFYISCQTRQGKLDKFFSHMNHDFPPSLSEYGKICHSPTKSNILNCLKSVPNTQLDTILQK